MQTEQASELSQQVVEEAKQNENNSTVVETQEA